VCGIRPRAILERNYCATECTRQQQQASIYTVLMIYICTRGAPLIMQREQRSRPLEQAPLLSSPCSSLTRSLARWLSAVCDLHLRCQKRILHNCTKAPEKNGIRFCQVTTHTHTHSPCSLPTMYMCLCANNATDNCFRTATIMCTKLLGECSA